MVYEPETKIAVVITKGPIDERTMPAMLQATTVFTRKHGCYLILADHRASELKMGAIETYTSPRILEHERADWRNRAALVYSVLTEDHQFMETVFRNSSRTVALFTDIEEARKWLLAGKGQR
jgi:hypothetical protein